MTKMVSAREYLKTAAAMRPTLSTVSVREIGRVAK
jgi:hypothetical protein